MNAINYFTKKIKNLYLNFLGFIHYHIANKKNFYPCKIIGEKNNGIIIIKKSNYSHPIEITIQDILDNEKLISTLHPSDALTLGSIAFQEMIITLHDSERKKKFDQIKNIMLNLEDNIHKNICQNHYCNNDTTQFNHYILNIKNKYPCKLVGTKKTRNTHETIIIFTILGKREGYNITLNEIISNKELLEKFHPTEAVKFGFISLGDVFFN